MVTLRRTSGTRWCTASTNDVKMSKLTIPLLLRFTKIQTMNVSVVFLPMVTKSRSPGIFPVLSLLCSLHESRVLNYSTSDSSNMFTSSRQHTGILGRG